MSRISQLITSLEEHEEKIADVVTPVTDEEMEKIEENIEIDRDETTETSSEVKQLQETVDDIDEETTSLESYIDVLKYGIETKNYSPQVVALTQTKLDKYKAVLERNNITHPAFENYNNDNLDEYYKVALESFSGLLARIVRVIPAAIDRASNRFSDWITDPIRKERPKSIMAIADKVISDNLDKRDPANKDLKRFTKLLVSGGTLPKNASEVIASIKRNIDNLELFHDKVMLPYMKIPGEVYGIVAKAKVEGGPKETSKLLEGVLKIEVPFKAVTPAMKDGSAFIDQLKVEVVENKPEGGKLSDKLDVMRKNHIAFGRVSESVDGKLGAIEFSNAEVIEIAKLAKRQAILLEKITKQHSKNESKRIHNYVNQFYRNNLSSATLATWEDDKALDFAVDYALKQHAYVISNLTTLMNNLYFTGIAVARLAKYLAK